MSKVTDYKDQKRVEQAPSFFAGVLAPSAVLTPKRLRERELARAKGAATGSDSPATRELRLFLQAQAQAQVIN